MPRPSIHLSGILYRAGLAGVIASFALNAAHLPDPATDENRSEKKFETTVFAGGCFWGVEAVFDAVKGVSKAGYAGGSKYPSEIFYANEEQKRIAEAYIQQLNAAKVFRSPIVTKVAPLQGFYPAEDYHRHFVVRNPHQPYVARKDVPKLARLHEELPEFAKGGKQ
jgi:peptide methionine sulfoxide reductase MsrA